MAIQEVVQQVQKELQDEDIYENWCPALKHSIMSPLTTLV